MTQISELLDFQIFYPLLTFRQPANCRRLLLIVGNDRLQIRSLGTFESLQWLQKKRRKGRKLIMELFSCYFFAVEKKTARKLRKTCLRTFERSGKIIAQINYFNGRRFVCTTQENTKKVKSLHHTDVAGELVSFSTFSVVVSWFFLCVWQFCQCKLCNSLDCAKFSILIATAWQRHAINLSMFCCCFSWHRERDIMNNFWLNFACQSSSLFVAIKCLCITFFVFILNTSSTHTHIHRT